MRSVSIEGVVSLQKGGNSIVGSGNNASVPTLATFGASSDIPVLQVVEELVEVLLRKLVRLQRIQTRRARWLPSRGQSRNSSTRSLTSPVIGVNLTTLCGNNSYINFVLLSDSTILFTNKRQVIVDLHLVHTAASEAASCR